MNCLTIITLLVILFYVEAVDFCSPSLCSPGLKHIACGNNGKLSANCPKNAKMIDLNPYKQQILDLHNSFRNRIAGGMIGSYSKAAKMATVEWNNQMASIAALNVKQCKMKHDECRNTLIFKKSGQNLAARKAGGNAKKKSVAFLVNNRVSAWFDEWKNGNMAIIKSYPKNYNGPPIGHFTATVNEKCAYIGCAASRYTEGGDDNFLIACNYAYTNIVGKPVYNDSTKAAIGCKTGTNPHYPHLCSRAETYNFL